MRLALVEYEKVEADPIYKNKKAYCICCNNEVISKTGEINVWHWAHKTIEGCEYSSKEETEWHKGWKNYFDKNQQEVIIEKNNIKKIADIKLRLGKIIELQKDTINFDEGRYRESFYENMIWIFYGFDFEKNFQIRQKYNNLKYSFRWIHPRKTYWYLNKPIFIDFGKWIVKIIKIYKKTPCGGICYVFKKEDFIKKIKTFQEVMI